MIADRRKCDPFMVYYKMAGLDTALVWTYLDPAHSR